MIIQIYIYIYIYNIIYAYNLFFNLLMIIPTLKQNTITEAVISISHQGIYIYIYRLYIFPDNKSYIMQHLYQYVRQVLSVHLPFVTDCTAMTSCPPNYECVYKGGFFIFCKDSKLLIDVLEENSTIIVYVILSIIMLYLLYIIVFFICNKIEEKVKVK